MKEHMKTVTSDPLWYKKFKIGDVWFIKHPNKCKESYKKISILKVTNLKNKKRVAVELTNKNRINVEPGFIIYNYTKE